MPFNFAYTNDGIEIRVDDFARYKMPFDEITKQVEWFSFDMEDEDLEHLIPLSFSDLPNDFSCSFEQNERLIYPVNVSLSKNDEANESIYYLTIELDILSWRNAYSLRAYFDALNDSLERQYIEITPADDGKYLIELQQYISYSEYTLPIENSLENLFCKIENVFNDIDEKLTNKYLKDVLVKVFDFPIGYSHICSQYLMWFGEFLKNLGIDANVTTENDDGKTSLIVTPPNKKLLQEIEQLLYQYLALPYAEVLPPINQSPEQMYAYQSAMMQIQHLQTQIQMKDTMLRLEQSTSSNLAKKIEEQADKQLLLDSLDCNEKYTFLNGVVSIPTQQVIGKNNNIKVDLTKLFGKPND